MSSLLSEIFLFLRGQSDHPIYHREAAGWSYVRAWRGLRRSCLPLMLLIMLSMSCCCGLIFLPTAFEDPTITPTVLFLMIPGVLWAGVLVGGEIINLLTGLLATALTATTISAEIEADTYALLRLTPIPPRQIVLAKLGAAFNQIRLPVITIMIARLVAIVGGILLLLFYVTVLGSELGGASSTPPTAPAIPLDVWIPVLVPNIIGIAGLVVAGLFWLVNYAFIKPLEDILLFLAVGLFASSLARTRSGGLFTAGGIRVAMWMVSYVLSQFVSSFFSLVTIPLALTAAGAPIIFDRLANLSPSLLMLGSAISVMAIVLVMGVLEFVVILLLLKITQNRAENLPFAGA
ncbi:MAG: hypothetical protein JXB30_10850 [Anaerolineae bacterium]|nr:hypothetical protein [Anaerolineae bacterium]